MNGALGDEGFELFGDYIDFNGRKIKITAIGKGALDPNGDPRYDVRLTIIDNNRTSYSEMFYVRTVDKLIGACGDLVKEYDL